jgi:hypothetical protein
LELICCTFGSFKTRVDFVLLGYESFLAFLGDLLGLFFEEFGVELVVV